MGQVLPQIIRVSLDTVRTQADYLLTPGTQINNIYIAAMPAGVNASLAIGQSAPFPIAAGFSFNLGDCNYIDQSVSIVTAIPYPGQTMTVVIVPFRETAGGASATSGV